MKTLFLPLVNWGVGALMIGIFALVCVLITAVVIKMVTGEKSKDDPSNS